ncbi:hypothetical protein [Arthrobacter sp. Bi83]|uniref:hypothetical protein n=1 Tax=Arthrobacter sp. Bi83 TaxID=2822353 RepID=UPI001E4114B0|nr:hypothetical protein [Arthrobacter sp. Bi83]
MATIDSRYTAHAPSESAVLGVSQGSAAWPLVWAGAGLVVLAGAAGLVALRIRRPL